MTSVRFFLVGRSNPTWFREKLAQSKSAKEMALFLIIENASLATNYPYVCAACMMYTTVPATEATAKKAFSKLKLIKSFYKSSMSLV